MFFEIKDEMTAYEKALRDIISSGDEYRAISDLTEYIRKRSEDYRRKLELAKSVMKKSHETA